MLFRGRPFRGPHDRANHESSPTAVTTSPAWSWTLMPSMSNLSALDEAGLKFIVGSRQVKSSGGLANHFYWNGNTFADGQLIDTIAPRRENTKTDGKWLPEELSWDPGEHPGHWLAVWAFLKKRATREGHTLAVQEKRIRAAIDGDAAVKS